MEQNPHVWIQLSLGAPCIPGRGGKEENISAQQILWLRFLGYRFLDLPAWDNSLQRIGQRIHDVLRVTAGRGQDDMKDLTLNEVRGSIGGVVHGVPRSFTSAWLPLPRCSVTMCRRPRQTLSVTLPPRRAPRMYD